MKKKTILEHFKSLKDQKEAQIPAYMANVDLTKEEKKAIKAITTTKKGPNGMHWPMVSPSKMVEILEAKKVDPEAEAKKLAIAIEKAETALKKAQRKETAANTLENATAKASSTDLGNIKKQKAHKKAEADLKRANANTKKAQAALDKLKA